MTREQIAELKERVENQRAHFPVYVQVYVEGRRELRPITFADTSEILELIAEIERLDKEAGWLAERLQVICKHEVPDICAMLDVEQCPFFHGKIFTEDGKLKCKCVPVDWREAAHKAMENRHD